MSGTWSGHLQMLRNRTAIQMAAESDEFDRVAVAAERDLVEQGVPTERAREQARDVASQVSRLRTLSKALLLDRLVRLHGDRAGDWARYWIIGRSGRYPDE